MIQAKTVYLTGFNSRLSLYSMFNLNQFVMSINLKKEADRRKLFKVGTPVIYFDGKKEITGEVIIGKKGHLSISSYAKTIGLEKLIYTPISWFNVRTFYATNRK